MDNSSSDILTCENLTFDECRQISLDSSIKFWCLQSKLVVFVILECYVGKELIRISEVLKTNTSLKFLHIKHCFGFGELEIFALADTLTHNTHIERIEVELQDSPDNLAWCTQLRKHLQTVERLDLHEVKPSNESQKGTSRSSSRLVRMAMTPIVRGESRIQELITNIKTNTDHLFTQQAYYDQQVLINHKNSQNYINRGIFHLGTGQYERALYDFETANYLTNSESVELYFLRGIAKEMITASPSRMKNLPPQLINHFPHPSSLADLLKSLELCELQQQGQENLLQHRFKVSSFLKPTLCGYCHYPLIGFVNQGISCLDCGLILHNACQNSNLLICKRETELVRGHSLALSKSNIPHPCGECSSLILRNAKRCLLCKSYYHSQCAITRSCPRENLAKLSPWRICWMIGEVYHSRRLYTQAVQYYTKATSGCEDNHISFRIWESLGSIAHLAGDYERAVTHFSKAIRFCTGKEKSNAFVHAFRGGAYALLGKIEEALCDFEVAKRLDSDYGFIFPFLPGLPDELLLLIFSHLPPKDLQNCRICCVKWRDVIKSIVK